MLSRARLFAIAFLACAPFAARAQGDFEALLTLRPVRAGAAEVAYVDVRASFATLPVNDAQRFSVRAPITYTVVKGIADRVDSLRVTDERGDVPLTVVNDSANRGGLPYYRHWRADRAVFPPIIVSYRIRPFSGIPATGPQFDFYAHGGGISTGGMALLVLPENSRSLKWNVMWHLDDLDRGSSAASTHGDGTFGYTGTAEQLVQAYYFAGPLGKFTPPGGNSGFLAYWLGSPMFDPQREFEWTARAYAYLRSFYRDTTRREYRVFIRAIPNITFSLGGTALFNSFVVGTPAGTPDTARAGPRNTVAHEMGHLWVGSVTGAGGYGTTWFQEGLNVFYTRLLLMRSGLSTVDDYLRDINDAAMRYYSSPYRNTSADSLNRLGFSAGVGAGSAQNVPYSRGSFFFADVDARVRAASGGKRKLDDVIFALFEKRRAHGSLSQRELLDAFVAEIGEPIRAEFDAVIIRGETITPVSDAFGPCFEREPTRYMTPGGGSVDGFRWVRKTDVPDAKCREW